MRKQVFCVVALLLVICLLLPFCLGCQSNVKSDKIQILCSVFPLYDWVKNIVAESDTVQEIGRAHV